jgi:hypothetical protein
MQQQRSGSIRPVIHSDQVTVVKLPCSVSIRPVEAQKLSLEPDTPTESAPFEIYVEDTAASSNRHCWVALYDSQVGCCSRGVSSITPPLRHGVCCWRHALRCMVFGAGRGGRAVSCGGKPATCAS